MSNTICDHTSVGMIIRDQERRILLIERKKYPYGFAAPAGHIDDHGSAEDAARAEVSEEVGLEVVGVRPLMENVQKENPCRREGGTHHNWWIYEVTVTGEVARSEDETKDAQWFSISEIQELADRTTEYLQGHISESAWESQPGLEPIWYEHFKDLKVIS